MAEQFTDPDDKLKHVFKLDPSVSGHFLTALGDVLPVEFFDDVVGRGADVSRRVVDTPLAAASYETAAQYLANLRRLLEGEQVHGRSLSLPPVVWKNLAGKYLDFQPKIIELGSVVGEAEHRRQIGTAGDVDGLRARYFGEVADVPTQFLLADVLRSRLSDAVFARYDTAAHAMLRRLGLKEGILSSRKEMAHLNLPFVTRKALTGELSVNSG